VVVEVVVVVLVVVEVVVLVVVDVVVLVVVEVVVLVVVEVVVLVVVVVTSTDSLDAASGGGFGSQFVGETSHRSFQVTNASSVSGLGSPAFVV
jgi:hypothetical protein